MIDDDEPESPQPAANAKRARIARLLPLFVAGIPHTQIARIGGVSLRSVVRYSQDAEMIEAIAEARTQAQKKIADVMVAAGEVAVGALLAVLGDGNASPDARVKAALGILDRSGHGPTERRELTGKNGGPIATEDRAAPRTREEAITRIEGVLARLRGEALSTPMGDGTHDVSGRDPGRSS